jgi:hypothetical protein
MASTSQKITQQMKEILFIKKVSEHKSYVIGEILQIILSDVLNSKNISKEIFEFLPPHYTEQFSIPNFMDKNIQKIGNDLGWNMPTDNLKINVIDLVKGDIIEHILSDPNIKNMETKDFIRICTIKLENRINEFTTITKNTVSSVRELPNLIPETGNMKKGEIVKISSSNESDLFQSYVLSIKNPNYNKNIENSFPEYRVHFSTASRSNKSRTDGIPYETFPEFAIGPSLWGEKNHKFKIHLSNQTQNTGTVEAWSAKAQKMLHFTGLSPHYGSPFESEGCMTAFSLEGIDEQGKAKYIFGQPETTGNYKISNFKKNKLAFENILGSVLQGKRMLIKNQG